MLAYAVIFVNAVRPAVDTESTATRRRKAQRELPSGRLLPNPNMLGLRPRCHATVTPIHVGSIGVSEFGKGMGPWALEAAEGSR